MESRVSNFSSSQMFRLMTPGNRKMTPEEKKAWKIDNPGSRKQNTDCWSTPSTGFLTYVQEKIWEAKLKRSINTPANTRPIIWGKVMEVYCLQRKLGLNYRDANNTGRLRHDKLSQWTGVPDTLRNGVVGDIKCQSSLIKFCKLNDAIDSGLEALIAEVPEYYWQLVSNAVLTGVDKAELILFVPYASELEEIQNFVAGLDDNEIEGLSQFQLKWIFDEIADFMMEGKEPSFAYLPDGSDYKDLTIYEFDVPPTAKKLLEFRVDMAIKMLNDAQ